VHTGVAVHYKGRCYSGVSTTEVEFFELSDERIDAYIASGEPMDKAGAYGIQGLGGELVKGYFGDYNTVVGLPLELTETLIREALNDD
jgi:septum formation protein